MNKTISILMAFLFVHYSHAQTTVAPTAPEAPKPPDYTSCGAATSANQVCRQSLDQQYQIQLSGYNTALKNYEAQMQQLAASASTPTVNALQAARSAEAVNEKGKGLYKVTQIVTMVASMAAFAKLPACAALTVGAGACTAKWTAVGIAMAGLSMLSGAQSGKHSDAQKSACETANQLTTTPSNCGGAATPYNPATYPAYSQDGTSTSTTTTPSNIVDSNGNCTASQELCAQIVAGLPPGTSLKDYQRGLSAFASGKSPLKVNPDGSLTRTTDGKKLDLAKFGTEAGLIEQGFSPSEAKAMLASLSKNGSLEDTAKNASGTGTVADAGLFDDAAAAAARNAGGIGFGVNGDANSGALDADGKNRSLASVSEGLVRDFNGETIGVQGDNIFKMMKRRYLLKDKQDSFISAVPTAAPSP